MRDRKFRITNWKLVCYGFAVILLCLSPLMGIAQTGIDGVLAAVLQNNKSIRADVQFWEMRKLQFKSGLVPDNPRVEYDYLSGSPENAGNQTDILITQSFDFPTSYFKKKQLAEEQIAQAEFQLISGRQSVLLEVKLLCVELVYRNKLHKELEARKTGTEGILKSFEEKLKTGDGNMLDVNKARLQLIMAGSEFQENISAITVLNEKLTAFNGGQRIVFSDTVYFALPEIPSFEELESAIESADPGRKILEQKKIIAQKEIELSRALALPKFEAGYHYQGIIGQKYNGIHTGMTIPLWENRNTVKASKSHLLLTDLEIIDHKNEHYYEIKQLYERYRNLKNTVDEFRNTLGEVNTLYLLNKSYNTGHISAIEYFMELNYYSTAIDNYLQKEKEYYLTIAELYKYKL